MKRWSLFFGSPNSERRPSRGRSLQMMTLETRQMMAGDAMEAVATPVVDTAAAETPAVSVPVRDATAAFRPLARGEFLPIEPTPEVFPANAPDDGHLTPTPGEIPAGNPLAYDDALVSSGDAGSGFTTSDPTADRTAIDEAVLDGFLGVDYEDVNDKEDFDAIARKKYDEYCVERELNKLSHEKACKAIGIDPDSDMGEAFERVYKKEKK